MTRGSEAASGQIGAIPEGFWSVSTLEYLPRGCDWEQAWAILVEYDLRARAYRRHRLGAVREGFEGVTAAMRRLGETLAGVPG